MPDYTSSDGDNPAPWCEYKDSAAAVVIGSGITYVGDYAFTLFTQIESVELPSSLTKIGELTFAWCSNLSEINISSSNIAAIGDDAFVCCTSLTSITLPATLTKLGDYVFEGCSGLTSADLSATSITSLGDGLFSYSGITTVSLPESLTGMGESVFDTCGSLKEIDLSGTKITAIGGYSFYECESLAKVTFPETLIEIGERAFQSCSSLTEADLSETKMETIIEGAFAHCTALESVSFPSTLTTIGLMAFVDSIITEADLSGTNLVSIGNEAFSCEELKVVLLPDTLTEIGDEAFGGCDALEKVYCTPGSEADNLGYYLDSESVNLVYAGAKAVKNNDETLYYISGFNLDEGDSLSNYSQCELYYSDKEEAIDTSNTVYTGFEIGGVQFDASEMGYDYIIGYKISSEDTVTVDDIDGFEANYSLKLVEKTEEA